MVSTFSYLQSSQYYQGYSKLFNETLKSKFDHVIISHTTEFFDGYFEFFEGSVDFYENDCLPINKLFSIRNLIIIIRRFRELFDILFYFFNIKIQRKKIYQLYSEI